MIRNSYDLGVDRAFAIRSADGILDRARRDFGELRFSTLREPMPPDTTGLFDLLDTKSRQRRLRTTELVVTNAPTTKELLLCTLERGPRGYRIELFWPLAEDA